MSITASQEQAALEAVPNQLFIGGEWRDCRAAATTLGVEDPSTGETLVDVADATPDDAVAALDAAVAVQAEWAAHPPRERGEILRRSFEAITARADELALIMTLEMGKPIAESKAEITYAAEFFRWFAEEAVRIEGRFATAPNGQGRLITMRQPVGPCYAITPWNFPMAMGTRKIGPAVAAGCTMVIKPAQQTPLSMLALARDPAGGRAAGGRAQRAHVVVVERGLQADHLRPAAAQADVHRLDRGGAQARRAVRAGPAAHVDGARRERAVPRRSRDADVDAAVEGAVIAKMRNMGEACTAANRFHVADRVADEFAEKLAAKLGAMKVGRGTEDDVKVGPLIDANQRDKVARAGRATRSPRARRRSSAARRATAPATSTSRPCSRA